MPVPELGVTFSTKQAEYLGLDEADTRKAYQNILATMAPDVVELAGIGICLSPAKDK